MIGVIDRNATLLKEHATARINRAVLVGLEPFSLGVGLFFAFFALSNGYPAAGDFNTNVFFSSGAAAILFLLIGVTIRRLNIPLVLAHAAACLLYGLALVALVLQHAVVGESLLTSLCLLLLAVIGSLVLSRFWFAVLAGMTAFAWALAAWITPHEFVWTHLAGGAAMAVTLGFAVMRARLASFQYAERRRQRERQALEDSLATAESRLRLVANHAQDIIFYWRVLPEPRLEYVNPALSTVLGYTPEEWYADPKRMAENVHPEDHPLLEAIWAGPGSAGSTLLRWLNTDGHYVWLELYTSPVLDPDGRVVAVEGIARDVTDRRVTELKFRTLVENSMLGICILQAGRLQYVNPMLAQMLGYEVTELQGVPGESLVYEVDRAAFTNLITNAAAHYTGELDYVFRALHRDGRVLTLHGRGTSILYNGANAVVGSLLDVTERKLWEAKSRESKRALATLISNLPGIAYRCANDAEYTMEFISEGCLELTGYSSEELLGNNVVTYASLIHPDDREHVARTVRLGLEQNRPFHLLYRVRSKTGVEKWVSEQGRGVTGAGGELLALEGFITDVTEQRRAELALAVSEERLRLSLEATQVGIWDWNVADDRIQWSGGVAGIFGNELQDLPLDLGRFIARLFPADRTKVKEILDHALASKHAFDLTYRIVRGDSVTRWISSKGSVWCDEMGRPSRVIGNVIDITERMAHEDALRVAKDQAEESNRVKSVIFANMSHEIRTPMTAILGYSDLLTQRLRGTPMQRDVETIYQGGLRLLHLLNSIIDLARIEAGRTEMNPVFHPMHETVARVVGLLKVLADQKGLRIVHTVDPELMVYTDTHAEEQVLTNLLGNAIRFTEQGVITISAIRRPFGPSKIPMAIITIEDTGIGISEEFLPHIFEEFRQESEGFGRQHEGSGLGLSISKKLVEKMTGQIVIFSRKGVGTTVTVALPLAAQISQSDSAAPGAALEAAPPVVRRNILVVEDDPFCGQLMERMLSDGNNVKWCETAEQGIELASLETFDLVLMDINLKHGKLNGIQGLHELRRTPGNQRIPVLAVTAYAMKGDRERFMAEGFDGYLAKPFEPNALRGLIDHLPAETTIGRI